LLGHLLLGGGADRLASLLMIDNGVPIPGQSLGADDTRKKLNY
jgi:hypothetical protein